MRLLNQYLCNKNSEKTVLLMTGGVEPSINLIKQAQIFCKATACADSGADGLLALGIVPDVIVGDMDSICKESKKKLESLSTRIKYYPTEKDFTDTQATLDLLFEQGYDEIVMLGATGGRLDHEQANIMHLVSYGRKHKTIVMMDDLNYIRYISKGAYQVDKSLENVSIVPINDQGIDLSLEGFYYPLRETHIPFGDSRCISNVITENHGEIVVHDGDGLLFISKDRK